MRFYYTLLFISINFYLLSQQKFEQEGLASFYADKFEGRTTASGETYDHLKMTAAHLTLPFNTYIKVTNLENQKSVVLRVNDRGPFVKGRIIDVSRSAAEELDFVETGLVNVKVEIVDSEIVNELVDQQINIESKSITQELINQVNDAENPYYSFDVKLIHPSGYGIQIGSFKEMENLAKLTEKLKTKYQKDVIVEVSQLNDAKLYRVIIGDFPTRNDAEEYKPNFKKEFPDCFVVKF